LKEANGFDVLTDHFLQRNKGRPDFNKVNNWAYDKKDKILKNTIQLYYQLVL